MITDACTIALAVRNGLIVPKKPAVSQAAVISIPASALTGDKCMRGVDFLSDQDVGVARMEQLPTAPVSPNAMDESAIQQTRRNAAEIQHTYASQTTSKRLIQLDVSIYVSASRADGVAAQHPHHGGKLLQILQRVLHRGLHMQHK